MKDRIYVCHTYYHVYITFLKELSLPADQRGGATLVLSSLSIDFENLKERVENTGLFEQVVSFEEKRETAYPELMKWKKDRGNIALNMLQRIVFTKKFGRIVKKTVPVDFRAYKDIYVYCDSDPIGYYLNCYHIPYHALEDGYNCLKNYDAARFDNLSHFKLKAFFSERLNLIFIQNGYGKYCLDMEVNDLSVLKYPYRKYIECPRLKLAERLTEDDKKILIRAFIRNLDQLEKMIQSSEGQKDKILILTEPLCTLDIRERIFRDIIHRFEKEGMIFLKPHPRDELDYPKLFAEYPQFDATVPMELLNFFPNLRFRKVVAVLTEIKSIQFAEECVRLGEDFMDQYEEPKIHHQNDQI